MTAWVASLLALQGPWSSFFGFILTYYLQRLELVKPPMTIDQEMQCRMPREVLSRLPDSLALVGLSQLRQLSRNLAQRRFIAGIYDQMLSGTANPPTSRPAHVASAYLRYPIRVANKPEFCTVMASREIGVGNWFTAPIHPLGVRGEDALYAPGSCPVAEDAVAHVANLPCHPRMNKRDALRVVREVGRYLSEKAAATDGIQPVGGVSLIS